MRSTSYKVRSTILEDFLPQKYKKNQLFSLLKDADLRLLMVENECVKNLISGMSDCSSY
jgi:hypothetical protein